MRRRPFVLGALCLALAVGLWYFARPDVAPVSSSSELVRSTPTSASPPQSTASSTPFAANTGAITLQADLQPSPPAPSKLPASSSLSPAFSQPTINATTAALRATMQEPVVDEKVASDLDNIQLMFRDYRTLAGENPVGTNAEIMKSIIGGNPKQATLGPPEGQALNADGELIDQWGTPYFFHQISAKEMQVRSAGPDRQMWTEDDIQH